MRKIAAVIGPVCDMAYGILMIVVGAGLIVGGTTGVLWL
jgi:5,10-methenyltetrahydromethanopterin hydrogenase